MAAKWWSRFVSWVQRVPTLLWRFGDVTWSVPNCPEEDTSKLSDAMKGTYFGGHDPNE